MVKCQYSDTIISFSSSAKGHLTIVITDQELKKKAEEDTESGIAWEVIARKHYGFYPDANSLAKMIRELKKLYLLKLEE
jgi:hypothetical protein